MSLKYKIKEFWRQIRVFFCPCQKWLTYKIPNTWIDKDHLFELVLSESLIHYVEGESCFETIDWDRHEDVKEKAKMIREIYTWYKSGQVELQKRIDKLTDDLYGSTTHYYSIRTKNKKDPSKIAVLQKLEMEIYDTNTKYMIWLIENRDILWT